jgi:hypothetical protein
MIAYNLLLFLIFFRKPKNAWLFKKNMIQ